MFRRISKIWHGETNGLTTAAFIVGAASMASRLVGVLRDRVLASTFGAGNTLDAYYAAFRVPDFLYNLIILGALSAGFIPVFAEYLETRNKHEAWRLAEQVLSVVGALMAATCVLLAAFAPVLIPLTVPGFSPEKMELTIRLSRIIFLSPFLLGLSAVMGGILQATRRFVAFSLAPVCYNLGIIFGAWFLAPKIGIEGVAWGVIIGAFLHLAVQASVAFKLGLRRIPFPSFSHSGVRRILRLMAPRTVGLAVSQFNLVVLLGIASTLATGSVAVFNLANNLQSFPVGIIGVSFAVAAFPLLSRAASLSRKEEFLETLASAAKKIMFLIIPVSLLFILLRAQIVRAVLGAGEFDWNDTIRTATVLGIFTTSLLGQSLVPLIARAFYAQQNTRTPLWAGVTSEIVNVVLAFSLRDSLGITGLAVAFSVATYVNLIVLWWKLKRMYGSATGSHLWRSFFTTLVASIAGMAAAYPVRQWIGTVYPLRTFLQIALQGGATAFVMLVVFLFAAFLLRSEELELFRRALNRRMFKIKPVVEGAEEAQGI